MKQIQPFQKHWLQLTSIVVCRLKKYYLLTGLMSVRRQDSKNEISSVPGDLNPSGRQVHGKAETVFVCVVIVWYVDHLTDGPS